MRSLCLILSLEVEFSKQNVSYLILFLCLFFFFFFLSFFFFCFHFASLFADFLFSSGVRLRFAAGMQARRAELLAILPSRADEDAFLRAHKINLPEEHEEENLDVKFFDVEEIDSMSDEDLGLVGPPHPRSVSPERWPEEHDRQLLRAFATWLKRDNLPLDARARSELMSSTGHDAKDVEQRCELWRNAYHPYKGKPRKKKQ
jgi:hypothetical protein